MKIKPCNSYNARVVDFETIAMPDGVSTFKTYYVSIIERDDPSRYEWGKCALSQEAFAERFRAAGFEGVGLVTAFPHITKIFRFSPDAEILMLVTAFNTQTFEPIDLDRGEGYVEYACYAEAALAADEYGAWASATTVEDYLQYRSDFVKAPVVSNTKLADYVSARKGE